MARTAKDSSSADFNYGDVTFLDGQTTAYWNLWVNVLQWNDNFQGIWEKSFFDPSGGGWSFQRSGTSDAMQYSQRGGAASGNAITIAGPFAGVGWVPVGVFTNTTGGSQTIRIYRFGVETTNSTDTRSPFLNITQNLTCHVRSSTFRIAELAIWRGVTLAQAALLALNLAAGQNPLVQAQAPVFYDPLTEGGNGVSTLSDIAGVITPVITATTPSNSVLGQGPKIDPAPGTLPAAHDNMQPWRGVNWLVKT